MISLDCVLSTEKSCVKSTGRSAPVTVEVLPRQPYNDWTKTLGAIGQDVR